MKIFPPPVVFEEIVCAIIIHPVTHEIFTVKMSPKALNQLAENEERHLPGGKVNINETPTVAIFHRMYEKLGLNPIEKAHPFTKFIRDGTLKDESGAVVVGGRRYVTTYWFIIEPSEKVVANIRISYGSDLVPNSERWVEFHQLIDDSSDNRLGSIARNRTPYLDLQQVWPYPHNYARAEIPPERIGLQTGANV